MELAGSDEPPSEMLTNLGFVLTASFRLVEAIQWYDRVLMSDPSFAPAHFNRSHALMALSFLAENYSANMLAQMILGFTVATDSPVFPPQIREQGARYRDFIAGKLNELGFGEADMEEEFRQTTEEMEAHSPYRKFCLEHQLTLSEHGIYCSCHAAHHDDVAIPQSNHTITGPIVARMELLLNRLKSEFSLARLMLYQSQVDQGMTWSKYDRESNYTELYEGEFIGIQAEMLRSCFRTCFGILDKIAVGIYELFGLTNAERKEAIYFESFYDPQIKRSRNTEIRAQLEAIDNQGLLALYSQAADLSNEHGEWRHFKRWRNELEH